MTRGLVALLLSLGLVASAAAQGIVRGPGAGATGAITAVSASTATGTLTASGQTVAITLGGWSGIGAQVSGTWTGTITFEATVDGTNWQATNLVASNGSSTVTTTTANGVWTGAVVGMAQFRARASAAMTGTATVNLQATLGGGAGSGGGGGGSNAAASATASAVPSSASYTGLNVGGNLQGAVGFDADSGAGTEYLQGVLLRATASGGSAAIGGDATNGLDVDVTRVPTDPFGANADAASATGSISAKLRFIASTGIPITGTVTVGSHAVTNAGTFVTQENGALLAAAQLLDNAVGSPTGGTAATGSLLGGGIYNSTPPTLTNGQQAGLQLSSSGALIVTGSAGTTQYAEDAAAADGNSIIGLGFVRRDTTPSSSSGTAGDYSWGNIDANGRIYVQAVLYNSSGTELTSGDVTEDAANSDGATGPLMLGVRRDAAASSAGSTGDNATFNLDALGLMWTRTLDPCTAVRPTTLAVSAAADTAIISASASNRTYICGGLLKAQGTAEVVNLWEGTGTACGTGSAALVGSTTEANGVSLQAYEGFIVPNTIVGASTNVDVCVRLNGTNRVAGYLTYVQAP